MGVYVFDIDGTISQNGLPVSENIISSIEMLSEKNNIIFASARPVRDMLPLIKDTLHQKAIFIGCNGGMAFRQNKMLYCRKFAQNYVEKTLNTLKKLNIPYVLDGEWLFSFSAQSHPFHQYIRHLSSNECEEKELLISGVTKILVLANQEI